MFPLSRAGSTSPRDARLLEVQSSDGVVRHPADLMRSPRVILGLMTIELVQRIGHLEARLQAVQRAASTAGLIRLPDAPLSAEGEMNGHPTLG